MSLRNVLAKQLSILVLTSIILLGFGISTHAGSISGTVKNSSGTPIDGGVTPVWVGAWQRDPCSDREWKGGAFIDGTGNYTISGLADDDYYIQTDNQQSDYVNEWWTGNPDPSSYICGDAQSITVSGVVPSL